MTSPYLAEVRDELRSVARDVLAGADPGADAGWARMAEAGWLSLEVPADLDGAGVTFAEVAVVAEELGRAAARSAYLGTVVLGVGTLNALAPAAERDDLLYAAGAGGVTLAVALAADAGASTKGDPPFLIEKLPGGLRLNGRAAFVPDAMTARWLLLLAQDADGQPVIACLDAGAGRLSVTAQPVLDASRDVGLVVADGIAIAAEAVWRFAGEPRAAAARLHDRAAIAVACDSLGVAEAMLAATVGYARVRQQFGRPIGSFQAVKHACADMLMRIAASRELVADAAAAVARADPDAWIRVAMAKSHAGATGVSVAGKAMQLHGGMGYTWESGIHVYLKRASVNRSLFGSPAAHRRRLADRYTRS